MATNKMTTVMALDYVLDNYGGMDDFPVEVKEKLLKMKEQAVKKNTAPRKPSAKQAENDAVRAEILDFLREDADRGFRISEICAGVPALNDATSQRVSGLLRTLYLNGMVDKYVDKRITYFKAMGEGI